MIQKTHAAVIVFIINVVVLVAVDMSQDAVSTVSLAGSHHGKAPPDVARIRMGIRHQHGTKKNRQDVAHRKLQGMGVDAGHGRRGSKAVVDAVDGFVQERSIMEASVHHKKGYLGHERVDRELEEDFRLPDRGPVVVVGEAAAASFLAVLQLTPHPFVEWTAHETCYEHHVEECQLDQIVAVLSGDDPLWLDLASGQPRTNMNKSVSS